VASCRLCGHIHEEVEVTRLYQYIGPEAICEAVAGDPAGEVIGSAQAIGEWVRAHRAGAAGAVTVTFVIDARGQLRIADRHSEHVACAAGGPVRSAGELTLEGDGAGGWLIEDISNQSTGFCPEPSSWPAVEQALDRAGLCHPGHFTRAFDFRRCEGCEELVLIKDDWFVCPACDADLPREYNMQRPA
jgi:hypothetical protein